MRRDLWLNLVSLLTGIAVTMAGIPAYAQDGSAASPAAVQSRRSFTSSDGVSLLYEVAGAGPPCVFIHGGPGQGYRSFQQLGGQSLEPFITMIYLDQRGSGLSSDADDYSIGRVADDVEELRDRLGLDQICLIAHSFGGVIALEYSLRYPEHLSKLVLVNASLDLWGPYRLSWEIEFSNRLLGREVASPDLLQGIDDLRAARAKARQEVFRSGQGYRFLTDSLATLEAFNAADGYDRSQGFGQAVVSGSESLPEYYRDRAPDAALIPHPTLVIAGSRDNAVGPQEYERFRFPEQTTVVIDGGHLLYFEENSRFTDAVSRFLLEDFGELTGSGDAPLD